MVKNKNLFVSRKLQVAIVTAIIEAIIFFVPAFEEVREELSKVLLFLAALVIGGIAVEDFAFWFGTAAKK